MEKTDCHHNRTVFFLNVTSQQPEYINIYIYIYTYLFIYLFIYFKKKKKQANSIMSETYNSRRVFEDGKSYRVWSLSGQAS